ncbi:MAG: helix-turn-helix domain-containing protein [Phycisphaerales bacterium JB064]
MPPKSPAKQPATPPETDGQGSDIGASIRAKREQMGFTQAELARRSGVSKAMLCDVEADRKNPTIRLLGQIALGLGCGISDLLDLEDRPVFTVDRAKDQRVLVDPENKMERRILSRTMVKHGVEVLHYTYPVGSDCEGFPPHPPGSLETAYVLDGQVRLIVGDEPIELATGDAATYRADLEHSTTNLGKKPARILYVTHIPRQQVKPTKA